MISQTRGLPTHYVVDFFLQKRHGIENKLDREGVDVLRSPLDLVMYSCVTWPRVRFAGEVQTFLCPTKVP